jgi:hypothetical protein
MTTTPIPRRPVPPARPPGPPNRTRPLGRASTRSFRRNALDFVALTFVLVFLLGITTAAFYHFWHANRIFTGVNVAGVPVGGLSRSVAYATLQRELGAYPVPPVNLIFDGQRYPIDPLEVRARVDMLDAVNQAYLVGRTGKIGDRLVTQFQSLVGGYTVTPRRI